MSVLGGRRRSQSTISVWRCTTDLQLSATPPGSSGKVFGFVYSGLDLGSSLTPLVFGWLLYAGAPRAVFLVIAAFMALSTVTVVEVQRRGAPVPARA